MKQNILDWVCYNQSKSSKTSMLLFKTKAKEETQIILILESITKNFDW